MPFLQTVQAIRIDDKGLLLRFGEAGMPIARTRPRALRIYRPRRFRIGSHRVSRIAAQMEACPRLPRKIKSCSLRSNAEPALVSSRCYFLAQGTYRCGTADHPGC